MEVVRQMLNSTDMPLHKIAEKTGIPYARLLVIKKGIFPNLILMGDIDDIAHATGVSQDEITRMFEELE